MILITQFHHKGLCEGGVEFFEPFEQQFDFVGLLGMVFDVLADAEHFVVGGG